MEQFVLRSWPSYLGFIDGRLAKPDSICQGGELLSDFLVWQAGSVLQNGDQREA